MLKYQDKIFYLDTEVFKDKDDINYYFNNNNFGLYLKKLEGYNETQKKAIETIFDNNRKEDLLERCQLALDINEYCFEAYYISYYLYDSLNFYYLTLPFQNNDIDNPHNDYELNDFVNIKILMYSFFIDIKNFSYSLNNLIDIEKYINRDLIMSKKLLIYSFLEDSDSMISMYENQTFTNPQDCIMLIVCLLKKQKYSYAEIVYKDMMNVVKYSDLISNLQELSSIDDEDSKSLICAIDNCFEIIESIPFFFSWIAEQTSKEKHLVN